MFISGRQRLIQHFLRLSGGFWGGATARQAWGLSLGFTACLIGNTALALAVNRWNKFFFDGLQQRDNASLYTSIILIVLLSMLMAIMAVLLIQMRIRLQLRWREWLTTTLISRWLADDEGRMERSTATPDNPEARIADDGRQAVELSVDMAGGILNSMLHSASFVFVLWYVGGALTISGVTIPGYLVIVAILYSLATSLGMYALGWPLVARVEEKAAAEGNFRYALTRMRQNAGQHADIEAAQRKLHLSFERLAVHWLAMLGPQSRMTILSTVSNVLAPAIPLLLCAPKFLAGEISLGDLMQTAAAFFQVHYALNWLADNALSLANWSASARRVAALDKSHAFES